MSSSSRKVWVDPEELPDAGDVSQTEGNVPRRIKQLCVNTVMAYGVGSDEDSFGYLAGKKVKFTYINAESVDTKEGVKEKGRMEVKTVAEVTVDKCMFLPNIADGFYLYSASPSSSHGQWERHASWGLYSLFY